MSDVGTESMRSHELVTPPRMGDARRLAFTWPDGLVAELVAAWDAQLDELARQEDEITRLCAAVPSCTKDHDCPDNRQLLRAQNHRLRTEVEQLRRVADAARDLCCPLDDPKCEQSTLMRAALAALPAPEAQTK